MAESARIQIDRSVIYQTGLYPKYDPDAAKHDPDTKTSDGCPNCFKKFKFQPLKLILTLIPILDWLPKYKWKEHLTYDLMAGFTVAVMHIPQGMAYALLGNIPPIIGIYMAFIPVVVYCMMGTSRHVSMGTFAIVCLMTGKVAVDRITVELAEQDPSAQPLSVDELLANPVTRDRLVEITTAVSLVAGFWQVTMGIFRLGSLSHLLSTDLVSGFTTGAAIQVLTSQIKNLLGVQIPRRVGIFNVLFTYVDIGKNIGTTNWAAVIISGITITCLFAYNELLKPYVAKVLPFPLPLELITIIVGTLVSRYVNFQTNYNITILDYIPTGLPEPKLAPIELFPGFLIDGLIIGIVAYAIAISLSKIFATKNNYPLDVNQELIAQGASTLVGSFFSCGPIAPSLSRSSIQEAVGGKTQLTGLFSCGILAIVLLWIGPFFETLPNCVLAGIIVVALKGMLLQVFDFSKAWAVSRINACVWAISFLATVVLDIEYGLGAGLFASVLILLWSSAYGSISVLGTFEDSELYADIKTNPQVNEIVGIKILKYTGSLNFVNAERFVKQVEKLISREHGYGSAAVYKQKMIISSISEEKLMERKRLEWIIFDFSSLSSVDTGALRLVLGLYKRFLKEELQILFTSCPSSVLSVMGVNSFLKDVGAKHFFPSVHDAVTFVSSVQNLHNHRNSRDLTTF